MTLTRDAISLKPVSEVDGAGTFSHYVYLTNDGAPDFMIRSGAPYRFVKDHLGSVRLVVNAQTEAIAQLIEYDAFGRVLSDSSPVLQPFGFAGGLYDSYTGSSALLLATTIREWADKRTRTRLESRGNQTARSNETVVR